MTAHSLHRAAECTISSSACLFSKPPQQHLWGILHYKYSHILVPVFSPASFFFLQHFEIQNQNSCWDLWVCSGQLRKKFSPGKLIHPNCICEALRALHIACLLFFFPFNSEAEAHRLSHLPMVPVRVSVRRHLKFVLRGTLSVLRHILLLPYIPATNKIWWTVLHLQKIWPCLC